MSKYPAFPRIEGMLVDLACRNGVDVRPTLLRVLTDLYVQARTHTPDEEAQYVELALRLIDSVDVLTRDAVARRLAGYAGAPEAIINRLRELGVDVAPAAIAPPPPAAADPGDAFFAAGSYERQLMLTNLDVERAPRQRPAAAVETCKRLEAAVLNGNIGEFTRLIESALSLPHAMAEKIVSDNSGEPIVVVARTLGMPADVLARILLLLNPAIGRSVQRVYELAALYGEISAATADSMIEIWRGRATQQQQQRPAAYQPALYDDETRSARSAATPSRYQAGRRSDSLATRFRNLGR